MAEKNPSYLSSNKSVLAFYFLLEQFEAGLVLTGSEVKSIRKGEVNLKGSYISVHQGEAYLKNAHISPYKQSSNQAGYEPLRERKLLLKKSEIQKLEEYINEKGISLQALNLHLNNGKIKLQLAACKSKKLHDRRDDLKQKAQNLEIKRALSKY